MVRIEISTICNLTIMSICLQYLMMWLATRCCPSTKSYEYYQYHILSLPRKDTPVFQITNIPAFHYAFTQYNGLSDFTISAQESPRGKLSACKRCNRDLKGGMNLYTRSTWLKDVYNANISQG